MMNCNLRRNCVSGSRQAGAMSMTWTNGTSPPPPPLPWLWLDNRKETYHYCCWFSVWGIFILFSDPKISHSYMDSWNILETDILHSSFNRHLIIFVMVANLVFFYKYIPVKESTRGMSPILLPLHPSRGWGCRLGTVLAVVW